MLALYRRLPTRLRRRAVRLMAPMYSVGANCVVVHDGRLLLVRQSYRRRWGLPGGLIGRGEVPAAAAIRETAEETGLLVEPIDRPALVVEPDARRLDVVHRCRPAAGADPDAVAARSPEIVDVAWFPLDALPELQEETADALRAVGLMVRVRT